MAASSSVAKKVPIPRRGVDYRGKTVLAPMVRSSELPMRLLALHYGADLVWGPETVDHSLVASTRHVNEATKTIEWTRVASHGQKEAPPDAKQTLVFKMHPELEGKKLIFQLGTADPTRAVEAARKVAGDIAGLDVNAGCPKPFSTTGGMGAELLRDPDRLCAILEALVAELTVPPYEIGVSVKIRILPDPVATEALVRRLVATGISGLTVHCRTPTMRPREYAIRGQLRMVADICREAGVACLMNGGVEDRDKAAPLVKEFGVDGAMIAIAAERNPSCFRTGADGGLAPWEEVTAKYMKFAIDTKNQFANTKYSLNSLVPGKATQRPVVQQSRSYEGICDHLSLTNLIDSARDLDAKLGLGKPQEKTKKEQKWGARKQEGRKQKANPAALAAGGSMAQARKADAKPRKAFSNRGVASPPKSPKRSRSPLKSISEPALQST